MKPATPQTEQTPSTQPRKVVFGGSLNKCRSVSLCTRRVPVMKTLWILAAWAALGLGMVNPTAAGGIE